MPRDPEDDHLGDPLAAAFSASREPSQTADCHAWRAKIIALIVEADVDSGIATMAAKVVLNERRPRR